MGSTMKNGLLGAAAVAVIVAALGFGYHYWTVGRFEESTDDAVVDADYSTVAPKVGGYIAEVLIRDNEPVKAGQLLARIDDRDYRTALAQAQADAAAAAAKVADAASLLDLQRINIQQAQATLAADGASRLFSQQDYRRYADLVRQGVTTTQRAQQAQSDVSQKNAILARDQAMVAAAQQQIEVLKAEKAQADAALDRAHAAVDQATLNLGYTRILAPVDGTVGAKAVRVGQFVQPGTQLMAVVPLHEVFVVGNFKETQLTYIRAGQPAEIRIDSFPGVTLHGHVDSLSPASGAEFALLPPDNATGNFTKVVQRIPVKIVLDASATQSGLLRPGMSVEPSVDTRGAAEANDVSDQLAQSQP